MKRFCGKISRCVQFVYFTVVITFLGGIYSDEFNITTTVIQRTTQLPTTTTTTTRKPYVPPDCNMSTNICKREVKRLGDVEFYCTFQIQPIKAELVRDGKTFFSVLSDGGNLKYNTTRFLVGSATGYLMLTMKMAQFEDIGQYQCILYYKNHNEMNWQFNLNVTGPPILRLSPSITSYTKYDSEELEVTCIANGNPAYTMQWSESKNTIVENNGEGELELVLKKNRFEKIRNYTFYCIAYSFTGDKTMQSVSVVVEIQDSRPQSPVFLDSDIEENSITLHWTFAGRTSGNSPLKTYELIDESNNKLSFPQGNESHKYTGLKPYTSYAFSLVACNSDNYCGSPANLTVKTLSQARPSVPTDVTVYNVSSRNATLSFKHGENLSQKNISYSRVCIYYANVYDTSVCGTFSESFCDLVDVEKHSRVLVLKPYETYILTVETCVKLMNNVTCSKCSEANVTTPKAVPSLPQNVTITNTDSAEIGFLVSWNPPVEINDDYAAYKILYWSDANDNHSINTNFKTYKNQDSLVYDLSSKTRRSLPSTEYKQELSANLKESTNYTVVLVAENTLGQVATSSIVKTDESTPGTIQNLRVTETKPGSLSLEWDSTTTYPAKNERLFLIGYREKDLFSVGEQSFTTTNSSTTRISLTDLKSLKDYIVQVRVRIRRERDSLFLYSNLTEATFKTGALPKSKESKTLLTAISILMTLLIVFVIVSAVVYCRRNGLCVLSYKATFYTDKKDSTAYKLRQSLKVLETQRDPMSLEEFRKHVDELRANSDYLFSEEYASLGPNRPDRTFHSANDEVNRQKNRYIDIAPFDQTRVRLMSLDGIPGSNYINANYVDGYHKVCAYVATQAPMSHTLTDFWRMIWELDSRIIIMLTNLNERGRVKCEQYWPSEGTVDYGAYMVTLESSQIYANYIVRKLQVVKTSFKLPSGKLTSPGEAKYVWQYHYTDWPDFGVPKDTVSLLSFILHTREHANETDAPLITHCSAGVGRTGTFIVIDAQMRRFDHRQDIEIYNFLKKIRQQRNFLVQQECQYIFLHNAMLDYASIGNTLIPLVDLEMTLNQDYWDGGNDKVTKLAREWALHQSFVSPNVLPGFQAAGMRPCNRIKNRDPHIFPVDYTRFHLQMNAAIDGSDYINASYIDSYYSKRTYLVTQAPLLETLEDFWRMICESKSELIINLMSKKEMDEDIDVVAYMPSNVNETRRYGSFSVKLLEEKEFDNHSHKVLMISNSSDENISQKVNYFHYQTWQADNYPRAAFLFDFMFDVLQCRQNLARQTRQSEQVKPPIVIHCRCGTGRSGLLCALFNLKEQIEDSRKVVDVFSTVRALAYQRPFILESKKQYEFLYKALVSLHHYLNLNTPYTDENV